MELPITLNNDREKSNEKNLTDLADMILEKPPEHKHVIESDRELLEAKHPQAELLVWHDRLGHLTFIDIKILDLLGIISKKTANVNPPK